MSRTWTRWLPSALAQKLEGSQNLQKIVGNSGWMLFDKVFRLGTTFLLNAWITRYLGPGRFGTLSYAIAFVSLFAAIANLGLFGIVLRDVVKYPESRHEILGTALALKIAGGLAGMLLALGLVGFVRPGDTETFVLVAVSAAGLLFQAFDVFDFWFLSQLQSKKSLMSNLPGFTVVSCVKVVLILAGAPLVAFALAGLAEVVLAGIGFLTVYQHSTRQLGKLRVSRQWAGTLLRDSAPLVFSGLMMMVYSRIDQVMLGQLQGNRSVGIYAAAVKLSEFWYVFPGLVLQSVFPSIVQAKKDGDESFYYQRLQKVFDLMVVLSALFVMPLFFFSRPVVELFYGKAFGEAGPVLAVYVLSGMFVMLGHAREYWVAVENVTRFSLYSTTFGAAVNIGLNFWLIPRFGNLGAAYATLIALVAGGYLVNGLHGRTRRVFWLQTKSLLLLPACSRLLGGKTAPSLEPGSGGA